ncbi:hypothetical protein [Kaistella palustris]|uniref:hypothetical protein n=1 Tax=Kaistella palustris TaxID=493376 RepID=UPI000427432F|nr:hypothetical protein [Kaistella palustris]
MYHKVPKQTEGNCSDNISERIFDTEKEAADFFRDLKKRFFDVNSWELYAGKEKAEFSLRNPGGELSLDFPKVNDYLRIKVPGLHNPTGDSYDWVRLEVVEEEDHETSQTAYMRVRPCEDPHKKNGKIAHFFTDSATSNFLIKREGSKITAAVLARNEIPNTEDLNLLEKLRNNLVAVGGMVIGSKFQWTSLTDGLLKKDEE